MSWPGVPLLVGAVAVPAGQTFYLEDPLASRNPTSGMIAAVVDGPGAVVSSRTYNLDPQGASFGQGIPGVLATGQTAPSALLLPLVHSAPAFWTCYASVVDDRTNDPTDVLPVER
jgi:hypothetical protein